MKPLTKVALVVGGYIAAGLIAYAVVSAYIAATSGPDRDSSAGMYAFGDALYFLGVFGLAAIAPTAAAAYFLRPYRRFWQVLSSIALALAATGLVAIILYFIGRRADRVSTLGQIASYAVLRILIAPLFALASFSSGLFAPERTFRLRLFAAGLVEVGVVVLFAAAAALGR